MSRRYYEWSMLVLRVVLGIIFLAHGLQKISGFEGTVKFFNAVGMPALLAYVVTFIETVGGAFLILGLFTRATAAAISLLLLGTIFTLLQLGKGFVGGYEFNLSLLSASVALLLSGSNIFALGNLFRSFKADSFAKQSAK